MCMRVVPPVPGGGKIRLQNKEAGELVVRSRGQPSAISRLMGTHERGRSGRCRVGEWGGGQGSGLAALLKGRERVRVKMHAHMRD